MTVRMRVIVRAGVAALVLAVLFFAGYAAVARRLLSGPKLRAAINVKADEFFMDWDEATSVWPGRVTVRNLRIRGSDPNVQWIVVVPEGPIRYSLLTLLRHKFLVTELRPQSIQFRLRQKVKREDAKDPKLKYLPPIPGFSDPPLREGGSSCRPESNPFTVELLDVTTRRLRRHLGGRLPLSRALDAPRPIPVEARTPRADRAGFRRVPRGRAPDQRDAGGNAS